MGERLTDMSRYDILYDLPAGEYDGAQVGGIRTRTIRAGDTIEVECYPLTRGDRAAADRECLKRGTRPGQQAVNRRNAEKRIRRLLETNFHPGDIALHLTFDYGVIDRDRMSYADVLKAWAENRLPVDEDGARREMANYIRRVKSALKRRGHDGRELKYLYVLESGKEPRDTDPRPVPAKYHFHMAIHAPGLTRDELEALWGKGYANADRLSFRGNGLAAFARYISKQNGTERLTIPTDGSKPRKVRRWAASRNLKEPDIRISDRKVSRRRAALVAADVVNNGRRIFEAVYPGYVCVEDPTVRYSDIVPGAYIFARLRKIQS